MLRGEYERGSLVAQVAQSVTLFRLFPLTLIHLIQ